jgi:hypothetical protein
MPDPSTASPAEVARRLLDAAVSPHPEDMADCYAERFVLEMPFLPAALGPARSEQTREELRARVRAGTAVRRYTGLIDPAVHETADPEVVIAEYGLGGELIASGAPFELRFVMVLTIRAGQVVHSRDYSDPIAGARLLGRLPQLVAAMAAEAPAASAAG